MNISKNNKFDNKGFTLLETLIYFSLLSIILLIVVDLFFRISESSLESFRKNALETEGEYVLNKIAYDIHRIDVPNNDSILEPPAPGDTTPWLIVSIDASIYTYVKDPGFFTGNEIIVENPLERDRLTSNSVRVENMSFTRISNNDTKPTVKISFTLVSTAPSKDGTFESREFESVFSVR